MTGKLFHGVDYRLAALYARLAKLQK